MGDGYPLCVYQMDFFFNFLYRKFKWVRSLSKYIEKYISVQFIYVFFNNKEVFNYFLK